MEYSLFGCKVNKYYLNQWLNYFNISKKNIKNSHLIATCVVTDRAKNKWVKHAIYLLKKRKKVYLTGCGAFDKGNGIDYDIFFDVYPELSLWRWQLILLGESPPLDIVQKALQKEKNTYTRKFIIIQNGCDTYCSFCLTILKRGNHKSRKIDEIIDEINAFVNQWGKEIILTWVNLAAWGCSHTRKPWESKLSDLLEKILEETTIERIRISSLWPEFLDDTFFSLVANTRFLPHFHFSIQHFDDTILKSMNRNYDSRVLDDVLKKIKALNRPDKEYISIGADIIVGFPGEDEKAFYTLLEGIEKYAITKLHAFPFSPHQKWETVPAWDFSHQVPLYIKKQRMQQLLEKWEYIREQFVLKNKQKKRPTLLEKQKLIDDVSHRTGRTPNYIQRTVIGEYKRGEIVLL